MLVPFAAGCAALGPPFLGRGQPADDKGGARWAKKRVFDAKNWGVGLLRDGAPSAEEERRAVARRVMR